MTNEELIKNVRRAYDKRKAEILKDMHDYNYWELYMRYELCEWLETIVNEYADSYEELIDYLKQKSDPLEWLYAVMLDREDSIWDEMSDAMDYTMKWEKEHGYDK